MKKWAIIALAGTVLVTFARRAAGKTTGAKQPKPAPAPPKASIDPGIVVRVPFDGDPGIAVHTPFDGDPGIVAGSSKTPRGSAAPAHDGPSAAQQADADRPPQDHHLV